MELELSRMAELAAERVQDWDPYACPGGGEFFPMSPKVFEESVGFYRNTRRRMWREDHIREPRAGGSGSYAVSPARRAGWTSAAKPCIDVG